MSADNWAICPQCNPARKRAEELANLESLYGKISLYDFKDRMAEFQLKSSADSIGLGDNTLREDYEIGVNDTGEFEIVYSCRCNTCGFVFTFKHKQQLTKPNDTSTQKRDEEAPKASKRNSRR